MKSITINLIAVILASTIFAGFGWCQNKDKDFAGLSSNNANDHLITDQQIQQRIEMYLLSRYHENHDDILVEVDQLPTPIPVNPKDWEIKIEARHGEIQNGANLVDVTVFSQKEIYKKFTTTARIRTFDDIVMAKQLLQREQIITGGDLELVRTETTNFKQNYFNAIDDLLNKQTKQVINKEKPIFTRMVELPDIIRRNDVIRIVVRLKNMEVTATGKALQNGRRGEKIRVQNLSTGKRLTAEVIDEKTVFIEL